VEREEEAAAAAAVEPASGAREKSDMSC